MGRNQPPEDRARHPVVAGGHGTVEEDHVGAKALLVYEKTPAGTKGKFLFVGHFHPTADRGKGSASLLRSDGEH